MEKEDYEARREARIERYRNRATKAAEKSDQLGTEAQSMAHSIPFGQPILVGHHSEKRDRNFRNRIHSKMGKSVELSKKAEDLEYKANSAENNRSISSDDPEAVSKLQTKLDNLELTRTQMKEINKAWRLHVKGDNSKLKALGLGDEAIAKLETQIENDYSWNKQPYPKWQIANLGNRIRTVRKRIERLSQEAKREDSEKEVNGIKVVQNTYENRIQLIFPGKPAPEIRTILKQNGFRWSPRNSAWQRQLNNAGIWAADRAVVSISKIMYQKENGISFEEADKKLFPAIKTKAAWDTSGQQLTDFLEPGDEIDEDLVDYFIGVLPPACYNQHVIQIGEPKDHDLNTGEPRYITIKRGSPTGPWRYAGIRTLGG